MDCRTLDGVTEVETPRQAGQFVPPFCGEDKNSVTR